jgi:hypothetical protein
MSDAVRKQWAQTLANLREAVEVVEECDSADARSALHSLAAMCDSLRVASLGYAGAIGRARAAKEKA